MLTLGGRVRTDLLGGFVAVLLGVAVVALTALLYTSSTPRVPDRFAVAPVVVASPAVSTPADPFPASRPWSSEFAEVLRARLAQAPGVSESIVDRSFYAQIEGDVSVEAHGWSGLRLGAGHLVAGRAPVRATEVAVAQGHGVGPGGRVTILTARGPATYTVTGVVDDPGLYLSDDEAARLAPGVRAIGLLGRPDRDAVARLVGADGRVLAGDGRAELEPLADATTRWIGSQVLAGMAALAAFVTIFVVASTFGLTVHMRRRELGLLRTVGAVPGQLRRLLYGEALAVSVVAAVAGIAVGAAAAPAVAAGLVEAGFEPAGFAVRYQLWPLAAAFAVGPVVALAGVWPAARRAGRIGPLETLREAEVDTRPMSRGRWLVGGVTAAAGLAAVGASATTADTQDMATFSLLATMALIVAAATLAPAVVPRLVRLVLRPGRGAVALLARENSVTAIRRTASTAAPVLLTVAFAVLITGTVQTATGAYAASRVANVRAGAVLVPDGGPGLTDAAIAATIAAAGSDRAASVAALLPTTVYVAETVLSAMGVDAAAFAAANRRLSVVAGDLTDLAADDAVVVTRGTASTYGWTPGVRADVVLADGQAVSLRVVAVVASAPAELLLTRSAVRAHDPSALTSALFLAGPPPAGPVPGARVVDVARYAAEADAEEDRLVWVATVLLVVVSAGYGAVAVANTLLMAAARRRRDVDRLRLAGATRRQIGAVVATEAALAVVVGSVLGAAVALVALIGGLASLRERAGAPVDLIVPWPTIGAVVALCLALAVAASIVPILRRPGDP